MSILTDIISKKRWEDAGRIFTGKELPVEEWSIHTPEESQDALKQEMVDDYNLQLDAYYKCLEECEEDIRAGYR